MVYVLIGIGYLALIGYILWQAYMLDQYRKWVKELQPPF